MANVRIDKVFQRIGGFGRWQRLQLTLLAPSGVFVCWFNLIYIFISSYGYESDCDHNHTQNINISTNVTRPVNDHAIITFTTIDQWQLLCERKWLRPLQQVCYSIGAALGVGVFHVISNRFGRKRPLIFSIVILTVTGSIAPYSQFHNIFCVFRFINGFLAGGLRICTLTLSLETASSRYHTWIISLWDTVHAVAYMLLASVASVSHDWRVIYVSASGPVIILILYGCLIPESPRWLLMIRRKADAERILRKIAFRNGHILRHEAVQNLTISEREMVAYNGYTCRHIFNDSRMCIWFMTLLACWFLSYTAYWTFSFSIPSIGNEFDKHLLFELHSWAGSVELISIGVSLLATRRYPRKKICSVAVGACSICCALTGVLRFRAFYVPLAVVSLLAKFLLVIYTSTLQLLTLEMFPKEIRFVLTAVTVSVSYTAIASGSYLALTADLYHFLPYMGCGLASIVVLGLTHILPETFRTSVDETDQEQRISTIDPPMDPFMMGDTETLGAVEMMDLRSKQFPGD